MIKRWIEKHRRWLPIYFFVFGFILDLVLLQRIDDPATILQQIAYLVIAGSILIHELSGTDFSRYPRFVRLWKYREEGFHFILGSLLNLYAIYFYKSASSLSAWFFILILTAVLFVNEFKRFEIYRERIQVLLYSTCLFCFLISVTPIVWGHMGWLPFVTALVMMTLFSWFFHPKARKIGLGLMATFCVFYLLNLIPPVPLAAPYMGIYHQVEKRGDQYWLGYTRSKWKFWQNGDQTFFARPSDRIHAFAQVFSPSRFVDELQVRWLMKDRNGDWQTSDVIPVKVLGGREEGFRLVTQKTNFQPGQWRFQIETRDGREVGRLKFEVIEDLTSENAEIKFDQR